MKKIAVIFGGCSPEYGVSLESAYAVIANMDRKKYEPVMVGISEEGKWFCFTGEERLIKENRWCNEKDCIPAAICPDKGSRRLIVFEKEKNREVRLDGAFPVLHGKNGEDGTVQGVLELAGIPFVGCGILSSALCMDKDRAHKMAAAAGVCVPRAFVAGKDISENALLTFGEAVGYPLFVKPLKAGSSFGVTKVAEKGQLLKAVEEAFAYDSHVIIEENIDGFEVGCAIMGTENLTVGEVDEIELSGGFFDFTEKYQLKTSKIHVPARISHKKAQEIKETAKTIYKALDCSGFARVDMFLTKDGRIVFNEVNTIPGFTEHSRFPGMMKAAGISFGEILDRVIGDALACV